MTFQARVNNALPLAVEGDFCSANPRATALNPVEGAFVAGPQGLTVGRFAWIGDDLRTLNNFGQGAGAPDCFIRRGIDALITTYLAESSMVIPAGFMANGFIEGDFWAKVAGSTAATLGAQAYANYADGTVSFGSAPVGASATGSMGATFTATGTGTSLAVTAVTGLISIGETISGTGVPAGTTIVAQVSGTTGGAGTYTTSVATTAAAATVTSFGNVLNVTAVGSGVLKVGEPVTGTGIPAGATIASQVSGATGGVGVYTLDAPATAYAASTALTVVGGVATRWYAKSNAAVGELVKISTWGN